MVEEDKETKEEKETQIKEWIYKLKCNIDKSKEYFNKTNEIIDKFNENLFIEELDEKEKNLLLNRSKSLSLIKKMNNNAIDKSLIYILQNEEDNILSEDVKINYEEIYNIEYLEKKKEQYSKRCFDFLMFYLLPIIDGIEAGISFIESSNECILIKKTLDVYKEIEALYIELLTYFGIKKVKVRKKETVNFDFMDMIDIEETNDIDLDMKIESIVESGYGYFEGEDLSQLVRVIRRPRVIVYRYI
ncbi:MAG: hypothetical protein MSA89_02575 [Clostridium sp.]|nr:hypothetical protein [Clostridium sp.]MCI7441963.1 hypothetical protein [Clostridium sp.]